MASERSPILLILDLDETLIHAAPNALGRPGDFRLFDYHVYRRPHLEAFLARCAEMFALAVWSSGSDDYVAEVVARVFPEPAALAFVWGRSRCVLPRARYWAPENLGHLDYVKPLKKVAARGWPLERMLIVDDTPEKCARNFGNAIYPAPFEGDPRDDELPALARYLETLKDLPNVRRIEKRGWRARLADAAP